MVSALGCPISTIIGEESLRCGPTGRISEGPSICPEITISVQQVGLTTAPTIVSLMLSSDLVPSAKQTARQPGLSTEVIVRSVSIGCHYVSKDCCIGKTVTIATIGRVVSREQLVVYWGRPILVVVLKKLIVQPITETIKRLNLMYAVRFYFPTPTHVENSTSTMIGIVVYNFGIIYKEISKVD